VASVIRDRVPDIRDERGLVGKLLVLWLVVVVVLGLAAVDAGSILMLRVRTGDLADDAATAAADAFAETRDERVATLAALETIEASDGPARLRRIGVRRGEVTVAVTSRADTIVVGRIPLIDDLARVTVTRSSGPSG
jgi:hypothetical protein